MEKTKDPAAVALGRKGGKNSRVNLSEAEKKELGQRAARARWGEPKKAAKKKPRKTP